MRFAEPLFALMIVSVVVAWWNVEQRKPDVKPHTEVTQQMWQAEFQEAQKHLSDNNLTAAESSLLKSLDLALHLPPHHKGVAESYDDLGQLYYRQQKFTLCLEAQGKAVSSLILAEGLDSAELSIYLTRYGWAKKASKHTEPEISPTAFIGMYPPYKGPRFQTELKELIATPDLEPDAADRLGQLVR